MAHFTIKQYYKKGFANVQRNVCMKLVFVNHFYKKTLYNKHRIVNVLALSFTLRHVIGWLYFKGFNYMFLEGNLFIAYRFIKIKRNSRTRSIFPIPMFLGTIIADTFCLKNTVDNADVSRS